MIFIKFSITLLLTLCFYFNNAQNVMPFYWEPIKNDITFLSKRKVKEIRIESYGVIPCVEKFSLDSNSCIVAFDGRCYFNIISGDLYYNKRSCNNDSYRGVVIADDQTQNIIRIENNSGIKVYKYNSRGYVISKQELDNNNSMSWYHDSTLNFYNDSLIDYQLFKGYSEEGDINETRRKEFFYSDKDELIEIKLYVIGKEKQLVYKVKLTHLENGLPDKVIIYCVNEKGKLKVDDKIRYTYEFY